MITANLIGINSLKSIKNSSLTFFLITILPLVSFYSQVRKIKDTEN